MTHTQYAIRNIEINMSRLNARFLPLLALLLIPLLACGPIPEREGLLTGLLSGGTPTPIPSPTPIGDSITFNVESYSASLREGDVVPGTVITYIGRGDNGAYNVLIDGLPAARQINDSLNWKGIVAPGVTGLYTLRLSAEAETGVIVAGSTRLTILDPFPLEVPISGQPSSALQYNISGLDYTVPVGFAIPGTPLVYKGRTEVGAELTGTQSYPFVDVNDSLRWAGQLRDNVTILYDLRVISIEEAQIRLQGTAQLWIE